MLALLSVFFLVPPLQAAPKIGVFPQNNDGTAKAKTDQYEQWLGRPVDYILQFPPGDTWDHIVGNNGAGLAWWINQWSGYPQSYRDRIIISLNMLPLNQGATHAQGATGAYDGYWTTVATKLVAAGYGNCIIRPGWEFTGSWYPWYVAPGQETNFKNHWIHLVNSMRSVPGANFKFLWNPTLGYLSYNPLNCFAGAQYVDYIGLDIYDVNQRYNIAGYPDSLPTWQVDNIRANAWNDIKQWASTYTLDWWVNQAATLGVPLCVPEWGLNTITSGNQTGQGGRDNPYFVQKMYEWMNNPANNVAFHSYFDWGNGTNSWNHSLCFSTQYPVSRALYIQLFGSTGTSAPSFTDTFDAGTATQWSAGTTSPWSVVQDSGNNAYQCAFGWSYSTLSSAGDSAWSDYQVALDFKITQMETWSYSYLYGRYIDGNNNYQVSLEKTDTYTRIRLTRKTAGVSTILATVSTALPLNTWQNLLFIMDGAHLTVSVNGTNLIDVQDSAPLATGKIALATQKQALRVDNVTVSPVSHVVFTDTFDAGTAAQWSTGTTSPWSVVADGGNNAYQCAFGWSGSTVSSAGDATWSNCQTTLDFKITQMETWSYSYIYGRYADGNNNYQVSLEKTDTYTRIRLTRKAGGVSTVLATVNTTLPLNTWQTLVFTMNGAHLTVDINGANLIDLQDSAPLSAGKIALATQKQGLRVDNVSVTRY